MNKRDELKFLIKEENYDIIAVTEVLPKNKKNVQIGEEELKLDGYNHFHKDFTDYNGRGCIIYTKESIPAYFIDQKDKSFIEDISVGIQCLNQPKLLITCIYRSPSNNDHRCIQELQETFEKTNIGGTHYDLKLIMGDFNIKDINWQNETTTHEYDHLSTKFLEAARDSFLIQHVQDFTRSRNSDTPAILDLIFTNEEGMIENLEHKPPLGKSDHDVLSFNLKCTNQDRPCQSEKPCFFKGDYDTIKTKLSSFDWEQELCAGGIEDSWERFTDIIQDTIKENIPVRKSLTHKFDTPWMDNPALEAIRRKRQMWKKYKYNRNPNNRHKYEEARDDANTKIRNAKYNYEKSIAEKTKEDQNIFWKYVQSKTKIKEDIQCIIDEDGTIITSNKEKAESLNQFFTSVFTEELDTNIPLFDLRTDKRLENVEFLDSDILNYMNKLEDHKSQGPDNMHPHYFKTLAEQLKKPLHILFNTSFREGKLPNVWKTANVTPLHKKGPKHNSSNYRPISLTSIICKLMEKIVRDALMSYMEENQLFTVHQHGFRKKHSCVTQLIEVLDDWSKEIDNSNSIDNIYLDFQKAFDKVPHKRLLEKLKGYGIGGNLLSWIESFLTERKQRVVLNGSESNWSNVTSGIPQGSVLGPTLFLIYINDLPDVVHNIVKLFADDTKLYSVVNNHEQQERLQEDINSLASWSNKWLLKFNVSKCKHLHLGKPNQTTYTMNDEEITKCDSEKDLGITVDDKLKFQVHINTQIKKANIKLGLIKRTFTYLDKDIFLKLYKSLVRPHLEYGSNVWSVIYKKEAIALENVQRRATRMLHSISHLSYTERLKWLGLPTLQYRRLRADMVETFRIIHDIDNINDRENIFPFSKTQTRGHEFKLAKNYCRTNVRKFSFSQRIVDRWNKLPTSVVTCKSVNSFKNQLNIHWKSFNLKFIPDCYGPEAEHKSLNIEKDQRCTAYNRSRVQ
ncbi:hypothetical protein FSP39_019799 [Pinctada imbricata]|uniref:Reverse transcriptase domain-containing protein n=1 Tax=Pinctada imbricata TaxID=66713 RepID=A0AA89C425_PINIB|nr:hypothetical protein FSP39_019799 [Pinctada imbricata]